MKHWKYFVSEECWLLFICQVIWKVNHIFGLAFGAKNYCCITQVLTLAMAGLGGLCRPTRVVEPIAGARKGTQVERWASGMSVTHIVSNCQHLDNTTPNDFAQFFVDKIFMKIISQHFTSNIYNAMTLFQYSLTHILIHKNTSIHHRAETNTQAHTLYWPDIVLLHPPFRCIAHSCYVGINIKLMCKISSTKTHINNKTIPDLISGAQSTKLLVQWPWTNKGLVQ